jgi:hypothetical protein
MLAARLDVFGDAMAHFYIYGDESGKLAQSDYVSFCGYLCHNSEWERVSLEWNNLRLAWGVPPLHMRCVMSPDRSRCGEWGQVKREWGDAWEDKRSRMLSEFSAVILHSTVVCAGSVVDSSHIRSMPDSRFKREMRDPLFLGFHTTLMESLDKVDRISKSLSIGLVIDDDQQYGMDCYSLLNSLKEGFPRVRERVRAMTLANDAEYPGLQMADMISYEARLRMVEKLTAKDSPPTDLYIALTRNLVHQPKLWSAEFLDKAATD